MKASSLLFVFERLTLGLLLGLLIFLPLLPPAWGGAHNFARVAQMPVFVLAAVCLLGRAFSTDASGSEVSAWWWFCGVLLTLAFASTLRSALPIFAWRELTLWAGLIALAIVVSRYCLSQGVNHILVAVCLAWVLYGASYVLVFVAVLASGQTPNGWLMIAGFDNPRFLNHAQTVAIPLLVGVVTRQAGSLAGRRLAWSALILSFSLLALTFGRATIVALLAAGVLAPLLFGAAGLKFLSRLALAAGIGTLLFFGLYVWLPTWLSVSTTQTLVAMGEISSDHSRLYLWRLAVDHVVAAPWLGLGPMHFAHFQNPKGAHPHNVYLQVACEFGIPFLLIVLGGAVLALIRCAKTIRRMRASGDIAIPLAAFCACVAAMVDGAFSGNFVMPVAQLWISLAVGMLAGTTGLAPERRSAKHSASSYVIRWVAFSLFASQLWLAGSTLSEARQALPNLGVPHNDSKAKGPWWPRFWMDGWI